MAQAAAEVPLTPAYVATCWSTSEHLFQHGVAAHDGAAIIAAVQLLDGLALKLRESHTIVQPHGSSETLCAALPNWISSNLPKIILTDVTLSKGLCEILTRCRIAEMLISCCVSAETAHAVLQPCLRAVTHGMMSDDCTTMVISDDEGGAAQLELPLLLRAKIAQLFAVAARRRRQFDEALSVIAAMEEVIASRSSSLSSSVGSTVSETTVAFARAIISAEKCQTLHCIATESALLKPHILRSLVESSSEFRQLLQSATPDLSNNPVTDEVHRGITSNCLCLAAAHSLGLLFARQYERAIVVLKECHARWGSLTDGFSLLESIALMFNWSSGTSSAPCSGNNNSVLPLTNSTDGGGGLQPSQAQLHDEDATMWLPTDTKIAIRTFFSLFHAGARGNYNVMTNHFNALIGAVEARMKAIADPLSTSVTPLAETKLLISLKVTAYSEMILSDFTRLDLCRAASKLMLLVNYVALFGHNSPHCRSLFHHLLAILAMLLREDESAAEHLNVAACCGDAEEQWTTEMLRAQLHYSGRVHVEHHQQFVELLERFEGAVAEITAATREGSSCDDSQQQQKQQPPRDIGAISSVPSLPQRLGFSLLLAAKYLDERDYSRSIPLLKWVVETARQSMAISSPVASTALRLLAAAHSMAGNTESSELSITTSIQLATKAGDLLCQVHAFAWAMARQVVSTDSDKERQARIFKTYETIIALYEAQCRESASSSRAPEIGQMLSYLPDRSPEYKSWLEKMNSHGGGGSQRGGATTNSSDSAASPTLVGRKRQRE